MAQADCQFIKGVIIIMMTALGNKKNVKIFSFALAGVFIASVGAMAIVSMGDTANAAPTSDIGVVDQRQVISNNGTLALDYQKKLKETADEMQKDFDAKSANMSDAEKEKLFADMQQQFNEKRTAIEKEMEDQVTGVVKSIASKRGLSLVVDKSAVIYGGTDITKDVSDSLAQKSNASDTAGSSGNAAPASTSTDASSSSK